MTIARTLAVYAFGLALLLAGATLALAYYSARLAVWAAPRILPYLIRGARLYRELRAG